LAVSWIGFSGSLGPRVMTSIRCAPKALLQGAIEAQCAPGGLGEGLAQLDVEIDVSAACIIVHSGSSPFRSAASMRRVLVADWPEEI